MFVISTLIDLKEMPLSKGQNTLLNFQIYMIFDVLQTNGIILYPLRWVFYEKWVWLKISAQVFQHPLPAATGYFHFSLVVIFIILFFYLDFPGCTGL